MKPPKRQADELAKIHRLQEQVAAELAEERKRFAREAMEAKKRLSQAECAECDIETSRIRMAEEVDRKHQDLLALEKSLRSDIDTRLVAQGLPRGDHQEHPAVFGDAPLHSRHGLAGRDAHRRDQGQPPRPPVRPIPSTGSRRCTKSSSTS
ncbi:MAG: hypothetical protein M3461_05300 [Pseudomonadota bacterium]|nr:hypothetical protein [Pseudomonadota bacterium]